MTDREPPPLWLSGAIIRLAHLQHYRPDRWESITRARTLLTAAERDDLPEPRVRIGPQSGAAEVHMKEGGREFVVTCYPEAFYVHTWDQDGNGHRAVWTGAYHERWRDLLEWLKPGRVENAAATLASFAAGGPP